MRVDRCDDLAIDYAGCPADDLPTLDEDALRLFRAHGCFLARGVFEEAELSPIRQVIRDLLALKLRALGQSVPTDPDPDHFDAGLDSLARVDPELRWQISQAIVYTAPVLQLGLHPTIRRLARRLMGSDLILASSIQSIMLHPPGEDHLLLGWHQDYPYVQDSEDAVVFWVPLRNLDPASGALKLAPGSHRGGLLPMVRTEETGLGFADRTAPDRYAHRSVPVGAGDMLVFSTLLLHASVPNRADRARWALQFRYGNFEHPRAIARCWPATRPGITPFEESHPECMAGDSTPQ